MDETAPGKPNVLAQTSTDKTGARFPLAILDQVTLKDGGLSVKIGVKHKVPAQVWSTLRVTFQENLFTVYFNGQKLFEVEDATFPGPGKVGVWTKADSVTCFDDFEVTRR